MKKLMMILLAMAVSTAAFASNVKGGKFGVDYYYSGGQSSWGAWYHVTDMIAIAPQFGFERENNVIGDTVDENTTTWSAGLLVPIYLANFNKLDMFVAPGVVYASQTFKDKIDDTNDRKDNYLNLTVALGMQIAVTEQLHIFGMTGINYSTHTDDAKRDDSSFGLGRTSVGAIFYFN